MRRRRRWLLQAVKQIETEVSTEHEIVFYWRPGCGFCSRLRSGLRRLDLPVREVDIWEHPEAAAFVRSVARGYETVPTVTVGPVALVNPSPDQVVDAIRSQLRSTDGSVALDR